MQLAAPFNRCMECDEIITNPICANCLAAKMRIVVGEQRPDLVQDITGFVVDGETACISCGEKMGLCAHCFSRGVYEFLSTKDQKLAKEFMGRFDFELRRKLVDFQ